MLPIVTVKRSTFETRKAEDKERENLFQSSKYGLFKKTWYLATFMCLKDQCLRPIHHGLAYLAKMSHTSHSVGNVWVTRPDYENYGKQCGPRFHACHSIVMR